MCAPFTDAVEAGEFVDNFCVAFLFEIVGAGDVVMEEILADGVDVLTFALGESEAL